MPFFNSAKRITISLALMGPLLLTFANGALADDPSSPPAPQGLLPVPDYGGNLGSRPALTGDWNGTRSQLANKGVQLTLDWTQYAQSIVHGGRDSDSHYGGHLDYLLQLDLMRMGVMPGGLFTIRGESRYGNTVNGAAGPILPANTAGFFPLTDQLDDTLPMAVTDLYYTQVLSEHLAVVIGKLDTLDADLNEFASGRGKSQFMDGNFLFNSSLALRLPYSTLGVAVQWMPTKNISIKTSLVNTADASSTTGFTDFGEGLTWTTEADFQYRLGDLPGGMNIGALYSFDQDFAQLNGRLIFQPGQGLAVPQKNDSWAAYWSAWQYLYVIDPGSKLIDLANGVPDHQGVGLFARLGFADQDTNPVEWSGSFGIGGRGMIPSRPNDVFGMGYYYTRFQTTRFSGLAGIGSEGQGFEAFYNLALAPAAHLTFDVQTHDTALPNVDTAVILGMRMNLSF